MDIHPSSSSSSSSSSLSFGWPFRARHLHTHSLSHTLTYIERTCVRLVRIASVVPHEMECARFFAPSLAANPKIAARRSGQHHEPTSAGMLSSTVATDVIVAHIPPSSSSSSSFSIASFFTGITAAPDANGRGRMPHTPPSQSSSDAFNNGVSSVFIAAAIASHLIP